MLFYCVHLLPNSYGKNVILEFLFGGQKATITSAWESLIEIKKPLWKLLFVTTCPGLPLMCLQTSHKTKFLFAHLPSENSLEDLQFAWLLQISQPPSIEQLIATLPSWSWKSHKLIGLTEWVIKHKCKSKEMMIMFCLHVNAEGNYCGLWIIGCLLFWNYSGD